APVGAGAQTEECDAGCARASLDPAHGGAHVLGKNGHVEAADLVRGALVLRGVSVTVPDPGEIESKRGKTSRGPAPCIARPQPPGPRAPDRPGVEEHEPRIAVCLAVAGLARDSDEGPPRAIERNRLLADPSSEPHHRSGRHVRSWAWPSC